MREWPGFINDCNITQVLEDGRIELLEVTREFYKDFEAVEYKKVLESSNERVVSVEDYRYHYRIQVRT